jgi:GNAT superfamily N-acetyltransferase
MTKRDGKQTWQVREFRTSDKASLLRLSAQHYGDREQAKEDFVDWLYYASTGQTSFVPIAEDIETGEVLGFSFQVPFHARINTEYGICRLGCNALVHPDYRGQGIYFALSELVETSVKDSLFTYGFPKPRAISAHQRVGKFPVSRIPLVVRPLDMAALARKRLRNPLIRFMVQLGWWFAQRTLWRPRPAGETPADLRVIPLADVDQRFDDFWARVEDKYKIIVPRDSQFLRWRFSDPNFREYKLLAAESGEAIVGYLALRMTEIEGIPIGLIMDLLVEPNPTGERAGFMLIERAVTVARQARMTLAGCLILPHTQEYSLLKRMGFVEPPERFSPQTFRLMTSSLSPSIPEEYLADSSRWFVTMANHDAV